MVKFEEQHLIVPNKTEFLNQMRSLRIDRDDPFMRVYPTFLNFFESHPTITRNDFTLIANAAYGWMPRILKLHGTDEDWDQAIKILKFAKQGRITNCDVFDTLAKVINGSLVGASKLLHFANPTKHAIWDRRVYRYFTKEKPYPNLNKPEYYSRYLDINDAINSWPELPDIIKRISHQLGYSITPFRAIELTMWSIGGKR